MEMLIILGLILLNGVFAMSEIAVVSARKSRLEALAANGDAQAAAALELANEPNRFLSTVQIGITLVGVLAGAFGGASVARSIADFIRDNLPAIAHLAEPLGVAIIVGITTYLSLVIGELVPKRLALQNPEGISRLIARPMTLLSTVATPVVWLLSLSTGFVLRVIGIKPSDEQEVNENDVLSMIRQGIRVGVFDEAEAEMVQGVMQLDDVRVGALITPRTEIIALDINKDESEIRDVIVRDTYTTYPVVDGDIDNVIGIVRSKDLLAQILSGEPVDLRRIMKEPLFVPESVSASSLIQQFKLTGIHTALIVGEYGGIEGLVRMHDIMEQILGELDGGLYDDHDPEIVRRDDGSWLLDGQLPLSRLEQALNNFHLPEHEEGKYETLAGFIMTRLGQIPDTGTVFRWGPYEIEIVDMDDMRIDRVLVRRDPPADTEHKTPEEGEPPEQPVDGGPSAADS